MAAVAAALPTALSLWLLSVYSVACSYMYFVCAGEVMHDVFA